MSDVADALRDKADMLYAYGVAFCRVHAEVYVNDEWGCHACEGGIPGNWGEQQDALAARIQARRREELTHGYLYPNR